MLKIRITYADQEEMQEALAVLEREFRVLQVSKEYPGRGNSQYSNIYVDVEHK